MMLLIGFLFAYAGFTALCVIIRRHQRQIWATPPRPATVSLLRIGGYAFIALAWAPCALEWGWSMGTVGWVCCLSVAAASLVLPFTFAPRSSAIAGGVAAILGGVLFIAVAVATPVLR